MIKSMLFNCNRFKNLQHRYEANFIFINPIITTSKGILVKFPSLECISVWERELFSEVRFTNKALKSSHSTKSIADTGSKTKLNDNICTLLYNINIKSNGVQIINENNIF